MIATELLQVSLIGAVHSINRSHFPPPTLGRGRIPYLYTSDFVDSALAVLLCLYFRVAQICRNSIEHLETEN